MGRVSHEACDNRGPPPARPGEQLGYVQHGDAVELGAQPGEACRPAAAGPEDGQAEPDSGEQEAEMEGSLETETGEGSMSEDSEMRPDSGDDEAFPGEGDEEPAGPSRWDDRWPQNDPGTAYHAFTTAFDEVCEAETLCEPDELARLRHQLDQQLAHLQGVVAKLANRLQRRLLAKQTRSWEFDLEEGMLDAGRRMSAHHNTRRQCAGGGRAG